MIKTTMTVFPMAVLWCSDVTTSGASYSASNRKEFESVQTAFVPKTHADSGLFLLLKAAELSREWQKETVVGGAGRTEGVRPCGPLRCFQGDEIAKPQPVLDGFDRSNLERKLHESALGNLTVEQSADEPWFTSRSTGV